MLIRLINLRRLVRLSKEGVFARRMSSGSQDDELMAPPLIKKEMIETFLNLETLDVNLFRSHHLISGTSTSSRVYGGQVVGQALVAASKTVPTEFHPHSLHCYFLLAGDVSKPILYNVERLRDGKSFCTRAVQAIQQGRPIYTAQVSFHKEEADSIRHQGTMPEAAAPEDLKETRELIKDALENSELTSSQQKTLEHRLLDLPKTFDLKPADPAAFFRFKALPPKYLLWVKCHGTLGDDVRLHHSAAAYISDSTMAGTALIPHIGAGFKLGMVTSLDHSIWFHRYNFKIDEWMLYETESSIAASGRSFITGRLWARDGTLVLSTAQEALIRAKI